VTRTDRGPHAAARCQKIPNSRVGAARKPPLPENLLGKNVRCKRLWGLGILVTRCRIWIELPAICI